MDKYTYMLVRYLPDPLREESINIGILFYSSKSNTVKFKARESLKELKALFPKLKQNFLKEYLKNLEAAFDGVSSKLLSDELRLESTTIKDIAYKILQVDDSSMQWGKIGSGISDNLAETFESLSNRFVQQHNPKGKASSRGDKQVFRVFSRELERRNLLSHFTSRTIDVGGFTETLEHTYQNGQLHCLKPISLDLLSEEGIKDRVYREAGRYAVLHENDNSPKLKFYYLLGKPRNPDFIDDFEIAKKILQVGNASVFTEDQASQLPDEIEKNIGSSH